MSATNVARAGKRGNIRVGNKVSATMCPRLPGPLEYSCCIYTEHVFFIDARLNIRDHAQGRGVTLRQKEEYARRTFYGLKKNKFASSQGVQP